MTKISIIILLFFTTTSISIAAQEQIELTSQSNLKKIKNAENIYIESYKNTNKGQTTVIGFNFDTLISKQLAYTLTIAGAIGGNIGGYGMAGIGLRYTVPISNSLQIDVRTTIGSGGGGGLPAGGGLLTKLSMGLAYQYQKNISLTCQVGNLSYPNGSINTPTIQLGIQVTTTKLYITQSEK